ncbi:MAG TPA: alternative ribosome rescue aminoacyl-tRNA hydrolase ArfB [Vicinamibacteria bacterium]|nr:alternative ribosome rescue aminoacyl-tRNA hydrolase ArfB [Vicinamibacteria bacterium]
MPAPIRVTAHVVVPAAAQALAFVRSSGPGGQNVNKVASKVELRVDLGQVTGLDAAARDRLEALTTTRRDASGRLLVTSQRTRDQHRNLEDAREKVRTVVERALRPPKSRRPTRPGAAARARRLEEKKRAGQRKRARARVAGEDDGPGLGPGPRGSPGWSFKAPARGRPPAARR